MRNPDPCVQLDMMDLTYLNITQMWRMLPIGRPGCTEIFYEIRRDIEAEGKKALPGVVPKDRVLKKYPLDRKGIERAAKRKSATV